MTCGYLDGNRDELTGTAGRMPADVASDSEGEEVGRVSNSPTEELGRLEKSPYEDAEKSPYEVPKSRPTK